MSPMKETTISLHDLSFPDFFLISSGYGILVVTMIPSIQNAARGITQNTVLASILENT